MVASPHDALFKAAFSQPDIARSELAALLPPAVLAHLDLATLEVAPGSFVNRYLGASHTDLLYTLRTSTGESAFVYVVFEHQSSFDPRMPFRFLRYMTEIWERWLRDHPTSNSLPLLFPILLHHGKTGWRAAPEFASMFDVSPGLAEAARPFIPHFQFALNDLTEMPLETLAVRTASLLGRWVNMAFWAARSHQRLQEAVPFMRELSLSITRDPRTRTLLAQVYMYLLRSANSDIALRELRTILLEIAGPEHREEVMNAAEELIAEGHEKGLEKGRTEGLRGALLVLLTTRGISLSEIGHARIAACSEPGVLTRWLERAVTAGDEAGVFAS
jgi:predicted transposase/invertase (TIGR01784 family)